VAIETAAAVTAIRAIDTLPNEPTVAISTISPGSIKASAARAT